MIDSPRSPSRQHSATTAIIVQDDEETSAEMQSMSAELTYDASHTRIRRPHAAHTVD
jgi:hypothetical protein